MDDIQQESVTLPGGQALLLIGSAAVVTFSAVMLCHFAQREVSWFSFITSLAGFVLSFIIITLVPYDVAQSLAVEVATERGQRVDQVLVSSSWQFIYWATFLLCWLVFPVLMEYEAAGGFTVVGRLRSSIRRSTAWCAGYLVCAGLLVLWLVLGGTGTAGVGAWCIAASNAWGLLVSTFLMGHGLVAVPRQLWRQARPGESLARLYGQAARLDEERLSAQFELQDVLAEARAETSQRSIQFWDPSLERAFALLQQTMEECELLHLELTNGAVSRRGNPGVGSTPRSCAEDPAPRVEYLAQLHSALKQAALEARRAACRWDELLSKCLLLEDIEESLYPSVVEAATSWTWWPFRWFCHVPLFRTCWHKLIVLWLSVLRPRVLRLLAIASGALSAAIVVGQLTMFREDWSMSLLAHFFDGSVGFMGTQVTATIALAYMVCTAYWSVFRLKIAGWYGLYGNHNTDAGSLLWCASLMARLSAPLCYHFLLLIQAKGTSFQAMMGQMNVVPVLGKSFNEDFPVLIVVLVLCNLLNVYSKIVQSCGLESLEFDGSMAPDSSEVSAEGRRLVERERRKRSEDRCLQLELNERHDESRYVPLRVQIARLIEEGTLPQDWNASSPN